MTGKEGSSRVMHMTQVMSRGASAILQSDSALRCVCGLGAIPVTQPANKSALQPTGLQRDTVREATPDRRQLLTP